MAPVQTLLFGVFGVLLGALAAADPLLDLITAAGAPWDPSTDPCEDWRGVACANGSVTAIDLARSALAGSLPASLANLTALTALDVSGNAALTGPLPPLPEALQTLEASETALSGALPAAPAACQWTSVRLSAVGAEGGLTGPVPASWLACPLERLALAGHTGLTGAVPLAPAGAWNLTELSLSYTSLNGTVPEALAQQQRLQILELAHMNNVTGALPAVPAGSLVQMAVAESPGLVMATPPLASMPLLRNLDARRMRLSGPLPELPADESALATVLFSNNNFSGPVPDQWFDSPAAQSLLFVSLRDTPLLSGAVSARWFTDVPLLQTLWLSGTAVDCAMPEELFCRSPYATGAYVTNEGCSAARDMWAGNATGTSIDVSWGDPVHVEADGGVVVGFKVLAAPGDGGIDCDSPVACEADADELQCTATGLAPDTEYALRLIPVYEWGDAYLWLEGDDGEPIEVSAATTDGLPQALTPAVELVESTTVSVSWPLLETAAETGGAPVTAYEAWTLPLHGPPCNTTAAACQLTGLQPDTEYEVFVAAVNAIAGARPPADNFATVRTCTGTQRGVGAACFDCYGDGCDGSQDCRAGYQGELCGHCGAGLYYAGSSCEPCGDSLPLGLLLLPALALGVRALQRATGRSRVLSTVFRDVVSTLQLLALTWGYVADYSPLVQGAGGVAAATLDVSAWVPLECAVDGWTWFHRHVLVVYAEPALVALAFVALRWRLRREGDDWQAKQRRAALRSGAVVVVGLLFVPVCRSLFQAMACVTLPSGRRVLLADDRLACGTPTRLGFAVAGGSLLACLALALGALSAALRRLRASGELLSPNALQLFSPLFWRYRERVVDFECVVLGRKLAVVAVDVLARTAVGAQVALGAALGAGYWLLLWARKPFVPGKRDLERVGTVDVANALTWLGALCVVLGQLFAVAVVFGGAGYAAQAGLMAALGFVVGLYLALALWVGARERRRGFADPNLRLRGPMLEAEAARVEADMERMAAAGEYRYAQELKEALGVLRPSVSVSRNEVEGVDELPSGSVSSGVEVEGVDELHRRFEERAARLCGGCGSSSSEDEDVAGEWTRALAALEAAAVEARQFRVAHACKRDAETRARAVQRALAAHVREEHVAALDGSLRAHEYDAAAADLAGCQRAGVDVSRRLRAAERDLRSLAAFAGVPLAGGAGVVARELAEASVGSPVLARGADLVARIPDAKAVVRAHAEAQRQRRRCRLLAVAAVAAVATATGVGLAVSAAAGGSASGSGTAGAAAPADGNHTCEVYPAAGGACSATVGGRVGALRDGAQALAEEDAMFGDIFRWLPLFNAAGTLDMPDACIDGILPYACDRFFAECDGNCTRVMSCEYCDSMLDACDGLLDEFLSYVRSPSQQEYVEVLYGAQGAESFNEVMDSIEDCVSGSCGSWDVPDVSMDGWNATWCV